MSLPAHRTVEQAAAYLDVTYRTVLKAIAAGELKARKIGKRYLITEHALTEYVTGTPVAAAAKPGRPARATGRRVTRGAA